MRYLNRFFDNFESNSNDIIYNCENLLLGLTDNGYKVKVNYDRGINDSDILCITISSVGKTSSYYLLDYLDTISDYLSIDYSYYFYIYADGNEYNNLEEFAQSGIYSHRFIIYYEIAK